MLRYLTVDASEQGGALIQGFVCDLSAPDRILTVTFLDDVGQVVGSIDADQYSAAAMSMRLGSGNYGFSFEYRPSAKASHYVVDQTIRKIPRPTKRSRAIF